MRRGAAIGAVLLAASVVRAPTAMADAYEACIRASGAVDPVMLDCQDQELGRQDRALNAIYAALLAKLKANPETTAKLKTAERAWIAFRDAECAVPDYGTRDGSMDRMALNDCIIDATKMRIVALRALEPRLSADAR